MPEIGNARRAAAEIAAAVIVLCALLARPDIHAQTGPPVAVPASSPAYQDIVDEVGRAVRIPQQAQRIVSLAPGATETIYALGLQDRLVGDTDYCDYPADAQKKPKVGGAINPSLEKIVSLHPDLVLVTKSLNRLDTVLALERLGIPSYATDPHTVQEIISSTERLAEVLGAPEAGAALGADLEKSLADLRVRLAGLPPRRVLFVVWPQPLISVGGDTFIADALRRAGAVSIVNSTQSWPQVNLEEVARQQPDYLVFAASHSTAVSAVETLASLPGWKIISAVKKRRYAVVNDSVNRPAPRIITAIEDLARQLHPEAFAEEPESDKPKAGGESSRANEPDSRLASRGPEDLHNNLPSRGDCACAL